MVKNILDSKSELKWIPFDSSATVDNTGTFVDLTSVAQGTSGLTRIGQAIRVKSIEMQFYGLLADTTNLIRLQIFEWIPSTTSDTPSSSELQYYSSSVISPLLPYNPSRFKRLYSHTFVLDTYHPTELLKVNLKLDHKVSYDLSVDTGSRHIYMFLQSDSGGAPHPGCAYQGLVRFMDD